MELKISRKKCVGKNVRAVKYGSPKKKHARKIWHAKKWC